MAIDTTALRALLAAVGAAQGTRIQVADSLENIADILDTLADSSQALDVASVKVTDDAYDSGWNGDLTVPTKNAVYDKIESFNLSTGSYTPTITLITNLAASTAITCYWVRVLNFVLMGFQLNLDPTAAGYIVAQATLPFANSNFISSTQAVGAINGEKGSADHINLTVSGVVGQQKISISGWSTSLTNTACRGFVMYEVF